MNPTTEIGRKKIPQGDLPAVEVSASPREKLEEFLATRGLRLTQERAAILEESQRFVSEPVPDLGEPTGDVQQDDEETDA